MTVVLGTGNKNARIMFIGEAPGAMEEKVGIPFVGRSGKTLDSWLEVLEIPRSEVYITNLVKEKLPKNRNPSKEEIAKYKPMLYKEISEVDPQIIITLGLIPTEELIPGVSILKTVIGNIHELNVNGQRRIVMPLYHPAYVNRSAEGVKQEAIEHLIFLKRIILENSP